MEGEVMRTAVQAVLKTAVVVGTGATLKYGNKLSKRTISELSALAVNTLLPCFLVASMSHGISMDKLQTLVVLPLFALAHHLIGLLVGYLVVMASKQWNSGLARHANTAIVAHAFFNASALPLSLLPSIIHASPMLGGGNPVAALKHGSMCVVIYSILNKVGIWTFARHFLASATDSSKHSPRPRGDSNSDYGGGLPLDAGGQTKYRPRRRRMRMLLYAPLSFLRGFSGMSIVRFCVDIASKQRIIVSAALGLVIGLTPLHEVCHY
jgi:predicted permease